jgi:hypothetical protein
MTSGRRRACRLSILTVLVGISVVAMTFITGEATSFAATASGYYEDSSGNICVGLEFTVGFPSGNCAMTSATGGNNTGLGEYVLSADTTGGENTVIGYSALRQNTIGREDTAVGAKALVDGAVGSQDVALGAFTMENVTTASKDTALGANALKEVTTGSQDAAGGLNAMLRDTTGEKDAAFGVTALENNTEGGHDVAVGYEAAVENTTGNANTALGYAALNENQTGKEDTAVGTDSLPTRSHAGSQNTGLGFLTGFEDEGSGNVFLGYEAGYHEKGSNKLYIADSGTEKPLILGNFEAKTLTVNGRMEPGEAAPKPPAPVEGEAPTVGEISTPRKRSCAIVGNESKSTKFKCELKLGTRLIASVTVQKAEAGEPGEVESPSAYTVRVPGTSVIEVVFTKAPLPREELFITVTA